MEIADIFAKQVVFERLLTVLLSDCRYADLINDIKQDVADFEDDQSKSLDERALDLAINEQLGQIVEEISLNHTFQVLK